MTIIVGIFLAVFVFFCVVFIHELGHFLVARLCGVKVHEFGLGLPPRMLHFFRDKKGTDWTLNWLPLGGFVRLKWEDFFSPESRAKDSLARASWWKQFFILIAGVCMNFLCAAVLFGILFYHGTPPLTVHVRELAPQSLLSRVWSWTQLVPLFETVEEAEKAGVIRRIPGIVVDPLPGTVSERVGMQKGDIVRAINGDIVEDIRDVFDILSVKGSHVFTLQRWVSVFDVVIVPDNGKIGAYVAPNIEPIIYKYSFFSSLVAGGKEVGQQIVFSLRTLGVMIRTTFSSSASREQKQEVTASVGGPVALGRAFVDLADHGVQFRSLIIMTALISLSLWVFNLLPFPALDGGRIFFVLANQIIHFIAPRFKISPRTEQMIHSAGFIILIFLSILITWKDIFFPF